MYVCTCMSSKRYVQGGPLGSRTRSGPLCGMCRFYGLFHGDDEHKIPNDLPLRVHVSLIKRVWRGDTQEGSAKAAVHLLVKCTNIVRACTLYYKCVDNLATAVVGFQMILYYTLHITQRSLSASSSSCSSSCSFGGLPASWPPSSFHLALRLHGH